MKTFTAPMMKVVRLSNEDVIRASTCYGVECSPYICNDCAECPSGYTCYALACKVYNG